MVIASVNRPPLQGENIGAAVQPQCLRGIGEHSTQGQRPSAALENAQIFGAQRPGQEKCSGRALNHSLVAERLGIDTDDSACHFRRDRSLLTTLTFCGPT